MSALDPESNENAGQSRGRWLNLLLLLLFSALSLWLADLGFRAYEGHFLVPQYPAIESDEPVNLAQLSYNEGVVPRKTEPDEFRILSFGDSFTYSVMEPALSYNGIVQQQLNEAVPDAQVRVVNLGEPGTGPNSFRLANEYWSQIFQHQAVLFHIFLGNDVQDDAYLQSPLAWEPNIAVLQATNERLDRGSKRVPHKFPLRMLDYAWAAWLSYRTTAAAELPPGYNWAALTELEEADFFNSYFRFLDVADPQKLPALKPGYQQVELLLQRAQQIAQSGIKVAVVLGPSEPMVNDTLRGKVLAASGASAQRLELGLPARIIRAIRQRVAPDVPLLDLTAVFREDHQVTGEKLYFRQNTHWDEAGNRLAGLAIANFLAVNWLGLQATLPDENANWNSPPLVGEAELERYVDALLEPAAKPLPEVTGAARSLQLFDGVIGDGDNWAMAELGQAIELLWAQPLELSRIRIHLHGDDGRSYGLLVEAKVGGQWQVLADRREAPVAELLDLELPGLVTSELRITGTSNSDQAHNPDNRYLHIEELDWEELEPSESPGDQVH
jgi:hypothetical protein